MLVTGVLASITSVFVGTHSITIAAIAAGTMVTLTAIVLLSRR